MTRRHLAFFVSSLLIFGCARNIAEQLVSADENVRQTALAKLESSDFSRRREVVPYLVKRLGDPNGNVRRRAVQALSRLGSEAVNPLVRALRSDNPRLRASAAETLGFLGAAAKSAAGPLVEAEQDKDADVRVWAAVSLSRIKATMSPTELQLFRFLHGKKEVVSLRADPGSSPTDPSDPRRQLSALRGAGVRERARTILSLVERGPLAVPALLSALTDPEEIVRDGAAEALRLLTQDQADVDQAVVSFLCQGDPASKAAHDRAFKGIDRASPSSAPALEALTRNESLCVRLEAVRSLGALRVAAKPSAPALRAVARGDAHPLLRRAALRALGKVLRPVPTDAQAVLARRLDAQWSEMTEVLARGEVEAALAFFAPPQRDQYRTAFLMLGGELPAVARALGGRLAFRESFGGSLVTLEGAAFIQGVHQDLLVQFVKDEKDDWKIRGF